MIKNDMTIEELENLIKDSYVLSVVAVGVLTYFVCVKGVDMFYFTLTIDREVYTVGNITSDELKALESYHLEPKDEYYVKTLKMKVEVIKR